MRNPKRRIAGLGWVAVTAVVAAALASAVTAAPTRAAGREAKLQRALDRLVALPCGLTPSARPTAVRSKS